MSKRVVFKIAGLVHQSLVGAAPAYLADDCRLLSDVGRRLLRSNSNDMRSCSCHEHITNSVIGVSRPPVLDCGTTFHPDYTTAAGTYLRLLQTISENSFIWRPKGLVIRIFRRCRNKLIYLSKGGRSNIDRQGRNEGGKEGDWHPPHVRSPPTFQPRLRRWTIQQ